MTEGGSPHHEPPRPPPSFLRRQESMRSVGVKGTPNVRRRPITRGALGALVGRRADGGSSARLGGRMDSCLRRTDGQGPNSAH